MAAAEGDREGYYWMATCLWFGDGCEKDHDRALTLFKYAAEIEHGWAQWYYGEHAFEEGNWRRYHWWGRAAKHGIYHAIEAIAAAVVAQVEVVANGRILFEIASTCRGSLNFSRVNKRALEKDSAIYGRAAKSVSQSPVRAT
jgi:predicted Ser/Thr protein kinase